MKLLNVNEKGLKALLSKKIMIAILFIALIALTGCSTSSETITVSGSYQLEVDPDQAEVWAGISITKLTAAEAQSEANKVISDIIDGLRYKGISEDEISTDRLSLYEDRRYENGKSKVVGWRATQTLKIKTQNLDKVGDIVDVAVNNGANQIQNINFGLSEDKEQEYKQEALAKATTAARTKAETIASSLGAKLGKIKSVSESGWNYYPRVMTLEAKAGDAAVAEAATIMPDKVDVSANVNVVYEIK